MATSIVLSGVVALTITPVLCAMILQPHGEKPKRTWLGTIVLIVVGGTLAVLLNWLIFHLWGWMGPAAQYLAVCAESRLTVPSKKSQRFTPCSRPGHHAPRADNSQYRRLRIRRVPAEQPAAGRLHSARRSRHDLRNFADAAGLDAGVHQLQCQQSCWRIAKGIDGVNSVSALAGLRSVDRGPRFERRHLSH